MQTVEGHVSLGNFRLEGSEIMARVEAFIRHLTLSDWFDVDIIHCSFVSFEYGRGCSLYYLRL